MMSKFDFYLNGIGDTTPNKQIDMNELLDILKKPNPIINKVREAVKKGATKEEKNEIKRKLSYVTFGGTFTTRAKANLKESSGYTSFDLDDVENLEEVKEKVKQDKHTHLLFVSPSGKGYKFVVKIPKVKNDEEYKKYWISIAKHYGISDNDEACKDVSRACYLSYDPKPYFNPDSEVYTDKVDCLESLNKPTKPLNKDGSRSARDYREVCSLISKGKTKEEVFSEMEAFAKWSSSQEQYKELTYNKAKKFIEQQEVSKSEDLTYSENWFLGFGKFGPYVKIDDVVDEIRKNNHFATIFGKKTEEMWYYDEGIYKPNGRGIILEQVEETLGKWSKTKVVNEILNKIKRQTKIDREEFDNVPKELIPLENGVLNFKTGEFLDYSPKFYFKTKLNVSYEPKAKSPLWLKFIEEALYEEDIEVIQEWWGFCLYRDYFIKKGFIGIGIGDTGKSVFQNVLLNFFGSKNTSGLNLQKITKDNNFSKSSLYNKYVNLYDDMSSQDINEGGGFKMVTGRSPITAEYKFGDEFQFINFAKMTFCCNKIPPIKDTDDITYYNRWLPIAFDNVVPEEEQDKFLVEKLTTKEEMSGILNWALEGLHRLLQNGRFSYNKTPEQIKEIMDRSSHPLAQFQQDCLEESKEHNITKEIMYEFYSLWAKENNKQRLTKEKLGRDLPKYVKYIMDKRDKERYWSNVKFKEIDTLDTFKNNMRDPSNSIYYYPSIDIIKNKASNVSKSKSKGLDTYDTNSKKAVNKLETGRPKVEVIKVK